MWGPTFWFLNSQEKLLFPGEKLLYESRDVYLFILLSTFYFPLTSEILLAWLLFLELYWLSSQI